MNKYHIYKVQRISDKRFSTVKGWSDIGKVFHRHSHAVLHIRAHPQKFIENPSVIVTYTIEEIMREKVND